MRRRPWFALAGLAACYQPHVVSGVPCAPGTGPDRCPSGQVCLSVGGQDVCEPAGTNGDAGGAGDGVDGADAGNAALWWNTSWGYRRPIDVTAGSNGTPAGYSVPVTFDHALMVADGRSLISGDDVRIVDGGGDDLDRVLDTGSSWDTLS